ncbi:MAG: hypothetical protein ACYTG6_17770, partial [Planctomycetota bacterium]
NVVNDGVEFHDALLDLYRQRVDPSLTYEVVEEAALRLTAGRSNCLLSTEKLHAAGLALPSLEEVLPALVDAYGAAVRAAAR